MMDIKQGWRIWFGLVAGIAFGFLASVTMLLTEFPDRTIAMSGAFASRFAIGFLIPQVMLPLPAWLRGLIVAFLISTPDAIITSSYDTVYMTGALGGVLIGTVTGWLERRKTEVLETV